MNSYPQITRFIYWVNFIAITLSITLLRLPLAFGYRHDVIMRVIGLIPSVCVIFLNFYFIIRTRLQINLNKPVFYLFALFLFWWLIADIRTAFLHFDTDTFFIPMIFLYVFILILLVFSAFAANPGVSQRRSLRRAVLYAFALYLFMNVVFYFLGISPKDEVYLTQYPAQLLSKVGINTYRVLFPMADGMNSFGLLSAGILAAFTPLLFDRSARITKFLYVFVILIALLIPILTDSRSALVFAAIAAFLAFLPYKLSKYFRWMPFIISIIPLAAFTFFSGQISNTVATINRPSGKIVEHPYAFHNEVCDKLLAESNGALSNRPIIWKIVTDDLRQFKPDHIYGYGFRGHFVSSLSEDYACLFASYVRNLIAPSHQIWLQLILDLGYLGTLLTLYLLVIVIIYFTRPAQDPDLPLRRSFAGLLYYIILIGSLASSLTLDFYGTFLLFSVVTLSVILPAEEGVKGISEGAAEGSGVHSNERMQ